jgi:hypothetical protein
VSPSLVGLSDNENECDYGRFKRITDEIILHIANYLDFFYKIILEKVGRRFFSIIRSKCPQFNILVHYGQMKRLKTY